MHIDGSLLGILAGILTTLSYFPQVIKTWKTRSADDFSSAWIVALCAGLTLWFLYGIYIKDTIVMLFNMLGLIQLLIIAFVKFSAKRQPGKKIQRHK
jgi:MtN3 and saliva related transmembrane protein